MKVIFTELADIELTEACEYYELEFSGLGKRFKAEVKQAIKCIIQFPEAWQKKQADISFLTKYCIQLNQTISKTGLLGQPIKLKRFTLYFRIRSNKFNLNNQKHRRGCGYS